MGETIKVVGTVQDDNGYYWASVEENQWTPMRLISCDQAPTPLNNEEVFSSIYDTTSFDVPAIEEQYSTHHSIGCYEPDTLALQQLMVDNSMMTPAMCSRNCYSYRFFGISNGTACFCGNSAPAQQVKYEECSSVCYEMPDVFCGALNRISVYDTVPLQIAPTDGFEHPAIPPPTGNTRDIKFVNVIQHECLASNMQKLEYDTRARLDKYRDFYGYDVTYDVSVSCELLTEDGKINMITTIIKVTGPDAGLFKNTLPSEEYTSDRADSVIEENNEDNDSQSQGLSKGALAGIIVGSVSAVILVVVVLFLGIMFLRGSESSSGAYQAY